jgi:uncharacterized protein (DUF1697 family)
MPSYLALLRGINVGGRNKVAMADLRDVAAAAGLADATTYIQSGNLLFSCPEADTADLADLLQSEIASRLDVRPAVVVLSRSDLKQVIADNPYTGETNPKCLHAVFHRDEVGPEHTAAVAAAVQRARDSGSRDDARIAGRTLYLHTPDGFGRSELAARLTSARAPAPGTARNWATVMKLMDMLDG